MFYEILLKLCADRHISLTALLTNELHMSSGNMTKWKQGKIPKSDTVSQIAKYFDVSVDYLLGNEQKEKPPIIEGLDKQDVEFLDKLKKLCPEKRTQAENMIDFLLAGQGKKK